MRKLAAYINKLSPYVQVRIKKRGTGELTPWEQLQLDKITPPGASGDEKLASRKNGSVDVTLKRAAEIMGVTVAGLGRLLTLVVLKKNSSSQMTNYKGSGVVVRLYLQAKRFELINRKGLTVNKGDMP